MPKTEIQAAEALLNQGKIQEAERRFLALAEADPHNKRLFNTLGVIAFQQRDVMTAIARFSRALQLDPMYKAALVNMSQALRATDQLAALKAMLDQYAIEHPDDQEIQNLRTEIRRESVKPVAYFGTAQGWFETVGILMITRDHLSALKRTLPALLANALIPCELTIVDNHSTDGTVEWLQAIHNIIPVKHELILNPTDAGMLGPTEQFFERTSCRFLVRVTPDMDFAPGWLMEVYQRYADLADPGQKIWLNRNTEAVHRSLKLKGRTHLDSRREYARFYEEQGQDISVTRYGQERMFHPEGNPRLTYVADCAEGDCLDIGCQYGAYAIWLAKQGHEVWAVDLSRSYLREARHRLNAEPADVRERVRVTQSWAERLPFTAERFQTVLLSEILEHVIDPEAVLIEALRVLRPGGVLYLSMPGYVDDTLEHVRQFSEQSILDLLRPFAKLLDLSTVKWYYKQPKDHFMLALRKATATHPGTAMPAAHTTADPT